MYLARRVTPISVLVAVLVTFGILTKQNEITAFKACGISVHRLAVPVLVMSLALATTDRFVLAVQWHPETDTDIRLFRALAAAAG